MTWHLCYCDYVKYPPVPVPVLHTCTMPVTCSCVGPAMPRTNYVIGAFVPVVNRDTFVIRERKLCPFGPPSPTECNGVGGGWNVEVIQRKRGYSRAHTSHSSAAPRELRTWYMHPPTTCKLSEDPTAAPSVRAASGVTWLDRRNHGQPGLLRRLTTPPAPPKVKVRSTRAGRFFLKRAARETSDTCSIEDRTRV